MAGLLLFIRLFFLKDNSKIDDINIFSVAYES